MKIRAIVLAAGKGTRMKSAKAKVLHELCGRPLLWYILRSLRDAGIDDVLVVTNDELDEQIGAFGVRSVIQREQLGTGHAVKIAMESLERSDGGRIVVAYGDMPLVPADVFRTMIDALQPDGSSR
ncbi:MAG TPA: NTP transferase domain-containing protein, partial [Candidatus Baltobacteraceae bacterium]|nr:NTP transferase domain-containing protein [Candidatus Baltobacteraceae bacterium]